MMQMHDVNSSRKSLPFAICGRNICLIEYDLLMALKGRGFKQHDQPDYFGLIRTVNVSGEHRGKLCLISTVAMCKVCVKYYC